MIINYIFIWISSFITYLWYFEANQFNSITIQSNNYKASYSNYSLDPLIQSCNAGLSLNLNKILPSY